MSELIPLNNLPALSEAMLADFGDSAQDLISGGPGFPFLSIRGSKFRAKISGDETALVDGNTGDPLPSLEIVILRTSEGTAKNYYTKEFVDGDDAAPDCFSTMGDFPDPQAENKQCESCAACPHNVWGSKISPQGNKIKACSDSKMVAITFASNLRNEEMGGPLLLRVPPASLKDLGAFGRLLNAKGAKVQQIVTRIGFDLDASYPKLTFKAVRGCTPEEMPIIHELFCSDSVVQMMEAKNPLTPVKPSQPVQVRQPTVDAEFDKDPQPSPPVSLGVVATEKAAVVKKPARKPAAKKTAAVVTEPETITPAPVMVSGTADIDQSMDDILGGLDSL